MEFTKQNVKSFRHDFNNAISELEKQYQCKISLGNIRFSNSELRTKLTANTLTGPIGSAKKQSFRIGENVLVNHGRCLGREFTIIKKNRVNWVLQDSQSLQRVKVSKSLILKK